MMNSRSLCLSLISCVAVGCAIQAKVRPLKPPINVGLLDTDGWSDSLRLGAQTSSPKLDCFAQAAARYYQVNQTTLGDFEQLRANGCCGAASRLDSVQCISGDTPALNRWLDQLPPDRRTGAIGVGHLSDGAERTLCLVRLTDTGIKLTVNTVPKVDVTMTGTNALLFGRILIESNDTVDIPGIPNSNGTVTLHLPPNSTAVEVHRLNAVLSRPLAAFLMPGKRHCQRSDATVAPPLDAKTVTELINDQRQAEQLPSLIFNDSWQAPLTSWLERADEFDPRMSIVGLLDARGWLLPRARFIQITSNSRDGLVGLMRNSPSFRSLIADPYMTSIAVRQFDDQSGYLVGFIQETDMSTPEAFHASFLDHLNQRRKQLNLNPLKGLKQAPTQREQSDCASAMQTLSKGVTASDVESIWLDVDLTKAENTSVPSCTLHYRLM
jgi:hypothetical protein